MFVELSFGHWPFNQLRLIYWLVVSLLGYKQPFFSRIEYWRERKERIKNWIEKENKDKIAISL